MIRDVELLNHLPQFMQRYREMQEIMNASNPEFQIAEEERELILNNQFIQSCNEKGIKKFEDLMDIIPLEDDDLQTRISRVLTRWNDTIPYTYKILDKKLNTLCGNKEDYKIKLDAKNYTISIIINTTILNKLEEIQYLSYYFIPANLVKVIELFEIEKANTYIGATVRQSTKIRLEVYS